MQYKWASVRKKICLPEMAGDEMVKPPSKMLVARILNSGPAANTVVTASSLMKEAL